MNLQEHVKKLLVEYDYPDCLYHVLSMIDTHLGECVEDMSAEEFAFYRVVPEGAGLDKILKWIDNIIASEPEDYISIYVRKKK